MYFESNNLVKKYNTITVKSSVGIGHWATIPWIGFFDTRESATPQKGVHIVLLFKADMSGVYITLNQGITDFIKQFGKDQGRIEATKKAVKIRSLCQKLLIADFKLDNYINFATAAEIVLDYFPATIAYKCSKAKAVPTDQAILKDLEILLETYDDYIRSKNVTNVTSGTTYNPTPISPANTLKEPSVEVTDNKTMDKEIFTDPNDNAWQPATSTVERLNRVVASQQVQKAEVKDINDRLNDTTQCWLFQANPTIYDLSGAVQKLTELTWMVNQHAD